MLCEVLSSSGKPQLSEMTQILEQLHILTLFRAIYNAFMD